MAEENKAVNNNKSGNSTEEQELKSNLDFEKTAVDHFTVFIVSLLGSMGFLLGCILFFFCWIIGNVHILPIKPFDPFPFPILEMTVSLFAIILSVSVLINQNRQGIIEDIRNKVEFEVNVRAESEITKILNMLHDIQQHLGLDTGNDKELEEMKAETDIKQIHDTLDKIETKVQILPVKK